MERLKAIKERLINCVENQINDLSAAKAEELGAAVDMIKDLEETIYYCTIVEAMDDKKENWDKKVEYYPVMYYNSDRGNGRGYADGKYYFPNYEYESTYDRGMRDYDNVYPRALRDYREGRSGSSRRNYIESKEMHETKEKQMKELEKYMQELSSDIMNMINDSTPEEKQILSQKLTVLADKVR